MENQPKKQRVYLCVAKKTKYGWMGKLGMSDIAISFGRTNPEDLVISLIERPQYENRSYAAQPPQKQETRPAPPQRPPQQRQPAPQQSWQESDPGPQNEHEEEAYDPGLPF